MSTHNIGFYEDLTEKNLNYHQISSNTHLISSAVKMNKMIGFSILCLYGHLFLVLAFFHRCCHMLPGARCGYSSLPLLTAYMDILFEL